MTKKEEYDDSLIDFNTIHPELKEGEVFLINEEGGSNTDVRFNTLRYATKRYGTIAYDSAGMILRGCRPIFVSKEELDARLSKRAGRK